MHSHNAYSIGSGRENGVKWPCGWELPLPLAAYICNTSLNLTVSDKVPSTACSSNSGTMGGCPSNNMAPWFRCSKKSRHAALPSKRKRKCTSQVNNTLDPISCQLKKHPSNVLETLNQQHSHPSPLSGEVARGNHFQKDLCRLSNCQQAFDDRRFSRFAGALVFNAWPPQYAIVIISQ
jgi:hypothetical protein